jgi:PilZ domain
VDVEHRKMKDDVSQPEEFTIVNAADTDDRRKGSDRRHAPRRKMLKTARVCWHNGAWTECVVRNLSEKGAQLEISGPVPETFDLVIPNQLAGPCSVVWRQGNRVGIKFHGQIQVIQTLPMAVLSACRQHADDCRALAQRANQSDRDILLNMAVAWEAFGRRYRRKTRTGPGA